MRPALQTAPHMVDKAPQYVTSQVLSALNDTKRATLGDGSLILKAGILDSVTPMSFAGTAIPRGRIYAECQVLDASGNVVAVVWTDYLQTTGGTVAGTSSSPGMVVEAGWKLRAVVTQTGQGAPVSVGFNGRVTSILREGGYIHSVAPGTGPGEVRTLDLANPAAGADHDTVTVGAKTLLRLNTFRGLFVTDATVANRAFRAILSDSSGNQYGRFFAIVGQAAGETRTYVGWVNAPAYASAVDGQIIVPLPDIKMPAGHTIDFDTNNIVAGDNWAQGFGLVEEWAVP